MKKNTEFTLYFSLFKADGTPIVNPGNITKKVSIDGAAVADITASVTEENTTYGQLSVVLSAAEMNGTGIWVYIVDDTEGCVPYIVTLYPDLATMGEIAASIADFATEADIAEAVRDITLSGAAAGGIGDALVDILAAAVTNGVLIAAGAIKGVSYDASTAYPLAYVDSGATKVARTGADGDTLETLSDEIATEYALVSKWILNKLVRTDNLDGTITYRLYDDNGTDILKTWVYTTATATRGKAS